VTKGREVSKKLEKGSRERSNGTSSSVKGGWRTKPEFQSRGLEKFLREKNFL